MIKKLFILAFLAALSNALIGGATMAHAATFDPGRIIDDSVMTNANSMNVDQIQAFLNSKVPNCDTNGNQPASDFGRPDLTHAQYAAARNWQAPPYTCLRDKVENGLTAAQIIYNVSQQYSINPQTFIVLLQKESSLVTDTWPLNWQYNSATGYGCPDSTPGVCDASYRGLTNQITWAARLFRNVINQSPTWYSPYIKGNNFIQWSPIASCGGSTVNVQNWSTAALYDYTPYQPNQAALNAGYGMGDGCSAYGNRNFFLYFNDWFGSTAAPDFSAQSVWQQVYTDSTKATPLGWNASLVAGQKAHVVVVMKNTGNMTWTKSGAFTVSDTRLSTYGPWGRTSAFCDSSWVINCNRPAALQEVSVAPGQMGTFEFAIRAPATPGSYSESFAPIVDGRTTFSAGDATFNFNVAPTTFSAQPVWQQVYSDQALSTSLGWNADLVAGQMAYVVVAMKNTGNMTWTKSGAFTITDTRLATYGPWGRTSAFCDSSWTIKCSRPAGLQETSVAPGQVGTFVFGIRAPMNPGSYTESFAPIVDGRTTFSNGSAMAVNLNVTPPSFSAQSVWQQVYTDSTKATPLGWNASLVAGQKAHVVVVMKNTGNMTWTKSGAFTVSDTRLSTYGPWGRTSAFCDSSWVINCNRPAALQEVSVAPGQMGTFEFSVQAPTTTGSYTESFAPIVDGRTTFNGGGMGITFTVR
ncbi:MAG: hypothetical protein KA604_01325 [Candidatus Saccharimonas sp.]|nr:hypothetical protein [Candidatus Saccharimonas sp.]